MKKPHYLDRKAAILSELIAVAQAGETITYAELGARVGIPANGPWKGVLDSLAENELREGRPDITFVVIRKSTGYPGQIGFEPANRPTEAQKRLADSTSDEVWKWYAPR